MKSSKTNISSPLLVVTVVTLLALAIYGHTFNAPFVFDDFGNIAHNRFVKLERFDLAQLRDVAFRGQSAARPVAHLSFALNYYVGGYDVLGYHLVNISVHVINGVLVYLFALVTFRQLAKFDSSSAYSPEDPRLAWMSVFAASIFVTHPVQTQSVTYVVQRMTSMAVMFYLAALLCYIFGRQVTRAKGRCAWWSAGVACWLLALGTKQIAVTVPFAVLLYEWFFFQNVSRDWLKRSIKYVAIGLILVVVIGAVYTNGFSFPGYTVRDFTMGERLLTQFRVVVFYISLVLLPLPGRLSLMHVFSTSHSLVDPITTFTSLLTILALLGLAVCVARRWRLISFAILWFFLQLALESSFVPLEMAYEHRLYLPMVGVALAVPWTFQRISSGRPWAVVLAGIVIVALAAATYVRNQVWVDAVTLWSDVIEKYPNGDARAYNNRGAAYESLGNYELARRDHDNAIDLDPDSAMGYFSRAVCFYNWRKFEDSMKDFTYAIELFANQNKRDARFAFAYVHRAQVNHQLGKSDEALADLDRAIEVDPRTFIAYENRGEIRESLGRLDDAVADFSHAIELTPRNVFAWLNRGNVYRRRGKYQQALQDYEKAIELAPRLDRAHIALAWLLATCVEAQYRDGERAIREARRGCELTDWRDYSGLSALAAAYGEQGNFEAAVEWQARAQEFAPASRLEKMRTVLSLYLQRQPYRAKPGEIDIE